MSRLNDKGAYMPLTLEELGTGGLAKVVACGMGGTLIRRRVWETLDSPWFRLGQIEIDKCGEDIDLTRRASDAGLGVYVDLDTVLEHLLVAKVRPKLVNGQWFTAVVLDNDLEVCAPATRKKPKVPIDAPDVPLLD